MARIAGIDLPKNKRVVIGLTYIYGIGVSSAKKILEEAGVDENIRVNQAFIGAWGIDLEAGFTCSDPFEAEMRRKAIACSQQAIVVADHSKFGRVSLFSFANIDGIDALISDDEIGLKTKQMFRENGVNAIFAK